MLIPSGLILCGAFLCSIRRVHDCEVCFVEIFLYGVHLVYWAFFQHKCVLWECFITYNTPPVSASSPTRSGCYGHWSCLQPPRRTTCNYPASMKSTATMTEHSCSFLASRLRLRQWQFVWSFVFFSGAKEEAKARPDEFSAPSIGSHVQHVQHTHKNRHIRHCNTKQEFIFAHILNTGKHQPTSSAMHNVNLWQSV